MRALEEVFGRLSKSAFRQRFRLAAVDQAYLREKGLPTVLEHARDFVKRRLAPAEPRNDSKQTPFRSHPAFIAQHATATCCRGCLAKCAGRELTAVEQAHVVEAIGRWLRSQNVDGA
ncbi:DUF4186 domain-containing protein [Methylobacterium longum]|uniref:DUF4186 domain-containing protein n=1 Tax=Methylobacterium longum TaxID=767694 RepID=A0ABT8AKW1_9HYPH|nr:DUF4186 domain-containing protein [Methylobacterium longum]MDN3570424.1 DUF4186 domain-containing protein [Methylobacterium longum]